MMIIIDRNSRLDDNSYIIIKIKVVLGTFNS